MSVQVSAPLCVMFWDVPTCVPLIFLTPCLCFETGILLCRPCWPPTCDPSPPHAYSCLDSHACASFYGCVYISEGTFWGVGCTIVYVYGCILPPKSLEETQEPGFCVILKVVGGR